MQTENIYFENTYELTIMPRKKPTDFNVIIHITYELCSNKHGIDPPIKPIKIPFENK